MDGWMDGWVDGWVDKWVEGWVGGRMDDGRKEGRERMDGWRDGRTERRVNEWIREVSQCLQDGKCHALVQVKTNVPKSLPEEVPLSGHRLSLIHI